MPVRNSGARRREIRTGSNSDVSGDSTGPGNGDGPGSNRDATRPGFHAT
jgi:hypothetical protein